MKTQFLKLGALFHVSVLLMAGLIFSVPFVTCAQQHSVSVQAAAIIAAEQDANKDVNNSFWFCAGCFLSGLFFLPDPFGYIVPPSGVVGTYFYRPAPPPSRLIGKSPEYVAAYTSAYQLKRGNIQAQWASAGCLGGCLTVVAVVVGMWIGIERAQEIGNSM